MYPGTWKEHPHLNSRQKHLNTLRMAHQIRLKPTQILFSTQRPPNLPPTILNSTPRAISPQTRLILLDLLPEVIDRPLALRSRLHQSDVLSMLRIVELNPLYTYQCRFERVEL